MLKSPGADEGRSAGTVRGKYPDFLVIGAQKSGTTWLSSQLSQHPDIWIPPTKEIHYFDGIWGDAYLLKRLAEVCRAAAEAPKADFDKLNWYVRFVLARPRSDEWYASLFEPAGKRLAGDITPAYAILDRDKVAHVHRLMPRSRVIFIMREPIERLWSQFCSKKAWQRAGIRVEQITPDFIIEEMEKPDYGLRTNYLRTLDFWSQFYDDRLLRVLFHEEIVERPRDFLRQITDALGVSPFEADDLPDVASPVNETPERLVRPHDVDRYFAGKYRPMVEELAGRYRGPAVEWLERINAA